MGLYPRKVAQQLLQGDDGGSTLEAFVAHVMVAPPTVAAAGWHALVDLDETEATVVTTGFNDPACPLVPTIVGNAAGITGNVVIVGTDANDQALTETLAANGTSTVTGTKAFKTITQVTFPVWNADGDAISVGYSKVVGLYHKLRSASAVLAKLFDNSADTGTVTVSATVLANNRMAVNGTPNGAKLLDVYYLVN